MIDFTGMPPTRGHDLKHSEIPPPELWPSDAPHTGARLETTICGCPQQGALRDAPHTGARLETAS